MFDRYLFCKERLPAGTEFAVLDLMDDLEAGAKAAREKDRAKAKKALLEVRIVCRGVLGYAGPCWAVLCYVLNYAVLCYVLNYYVLC